MSSAFSRLLLGLCGSLLPWVSVVCTFSFKGIIRLEIWVVSRLLLVNFEHATEDPEETWSWRRQVTLPPRFFHIDLGSCKLKTLRSKDQVYHSRLLLSPWQSNKSGGAGVGVEGWEGGENLHPLFLSSSFYLFLHSFRSCDFSKGSPGPGFLFRYSGLL